MLNEYNVPSANGGDGIPVNIKLRSEQHEVLPAPGTKAAAQPHDSTVMDTIIPGRLTVENGEITLSYIDKENEDSEDDVKMTFYENRPGYCIIARNGFASSVFAIEQGKMQQAVYSLMFGEMFFNVKGITVTSHINENGGTAYLYYSVYVNGSVVQRMKLNIEVTPA